MGGNHSRYSHQKGKRYSALNLVLGAMVTDADQMESQSLAARATQELGERSIGTGVPKTGGILTYAQGAGLADPLAVTGLKPGHVVANGRTAELRLAAGQSLPAGAGMELVALQADLLGGPALPGDAGPYALFADVWDRHCGPAEDARLTDAAFLSAETSVRKERVAQLKFLAVPDGLTDAELRGLVEQPGGLPNVGDLRLTAAAFAAQAVTVDPCDPCAGELTEADLETGNDLFRFEIHAGDFGLPSLAGTPAAAGPVAGATQRLTVKWSRDNGGLEIPAGARDSLLADGSFDTAVFELAELAGEQRLGLFSAGTERLSRLVDKAMLAAEPAAGLAGRIIRVWEGAAVIDLAAPNLAPAPIGVAPLTGSITRAADAWQLKVNVSDLELTFDGVPRGTGAPFLLPGDAWCVEVREFTSGATGRLVFEPEPVEVRHDYVFLGQVASGAFVNEALPDTRPLAFPALTELAADDVAWDNRNHPEIDDANTVQGAIDLLFAREDDGCQCTFLIQPGRELHEQLATLVERMAKQGLKSALICFPVGEWRLEKPFVFTGLETVILRGCGFGSKIVADLKAEGTMFAFQSLDNVTIEDLWLETKAPEATACTEFADVRQIRLSRTGFSIDGRAEAPQSAVIAGRVRSGVYPPLLEAQACLFLVGSYNCGITVMGNLRLVVSNCQFWVPFYSVGYASLRYRTAFLAAGVLAKVTARQIEAGNGRYVAIDGLPTGTALDLEAVDPADRPDIADFWQQSLAIVAPEGGLKSAADFETARGDLSSLNWGLTMAAALAIEQLDASDVDRDALISGGGEFKLMRAVSGFGSGEGGLIDAIRGEAAPAVTASAASPHMAALFERVGRLDLAGSRVASPTPGGGAKRTATRAAPRALAGAATTRRSAETARTPDANIAEVAVSAAAVKASSYSFTDVVTHLGDSLIKDRFTPDWLDRFGDIRIPDERPRAIDNSVLNYGIQAMIPYELDTQIVGNRFNGIDTAILLKGEGQRMNPGYYPAGRTLVRDNVAVRAPRRGDQTARREGLFPITLHGCGNMIVEDNIVQQITDRLVDETYRKEMLSIEPMLPLTDMRFAAIGITGFVGPHVRVVGNSAGLYRYCVFVLAEPRTPGASEAALYPPGRPNYWVFQHNMVVPNSESNSLSNWAVTLQNFWDLQRVAVIVHGPNHPEPWGDWH